jgi:hypothetical protein
MLKYTAPKLDTTSLIMPDDDAIGKPDAWEEYSLSGDESLLGLTGEPTRYLIRPYSEDEVLAVSKELGLPAASVPEAIQTGDPDVFLALARQCVCGVSGVDPETPKPHLVQLSGRKFLSTEVMLGWGKNKYRYAAEIVNKALRFRLSVLALPLQ